MSGTQECMSELSTKNALYTRTVKHMSEPVTYLCGAFMAINRLAYDMFYVTVSETVLCYSKHVENIQWNFDMLL